MESVVNAISEISAESEAKVSCKMRPDDPRARGREFIGFDTREDLEKRTPKVPEKLKKPKGVRNKELGKRGENAAANFLYKRGYDIIDRNWECKFGEADIVARDGDCIVFVEVKTRKDVQKGFPSEAISSEKRSKYEKIALAFLKDYDAVDVPVRFDVISIVVIGPNRALIRHQINAFSVV